MAPKTLSSRSISVCRWLSVLAVLVSSLLMIRQELNYNQVYDEGAHIACGMEWLSLRTYTYETLHPPLARVAVALPLFLTGLRSEGHREMAVEGTALLNASRAYGTNLLLARLGVLPFFWLSNILIFAYMRRRFGPAHGMFAVILFCFCPPVLAHSGVATTDAPLMATFLLATLSLARLLQVPSPANGLLAGCSFALALLTKFTALPFLCVTAVFLLFWVWRSGRNPRSLVAPLALGCAAACLIIWAAYHFSVGTFFTPANIYDKAIAKLNAMRPWERNIFLRWKLPAPEFFNGLYGAFLAGAKQKRFGYVLGQTYAGGRWYFFPVAVIAKTPIPLILLAGIGVWSMLGASRRRSHETAVLVGGAAGPMLVGILGDLNLGLRHVLPMYPFLAMLGAIGVVSLAREAASKWNTSAIDFRDLIRRPRIVAAGILVVWEVAACIVATPQFLPYFNEAAMPFYGFVLVDSDLDWGQDFYHLEARLSGVDPAQVSYAYFGDATILHHNSAQWGSLTPHHPVTGWVAISETTIRRQAQDFDWLRDLPFERIGRSIRLYHIPPTGDD